MINTEKFSKESLKLIEDEFGISPEEFSKFDKKQWRELKMKCFDIECSEIDEEGNCSKRGNVAADIVDFTYKDIKSE